MAFGMGRGGCLPAIRIRVSANNRQSTQAVTPNKIQLPSIFGARHMSNGAHLGYIGASESGKSKGLMSLAAARTSEIHQLDFVGELSDPNAFQRPEIVRFAIAFQPNLGASIAVEPAG
jgi:hypothetical protein